MLRCQATRLASPWLARGMASKVSLRDLPYGYSALEPVIGGELMELHHSKHHQAYVTGLNKALEEYEEAEHKQDVGRMIALQAAIKFNGGGHLNHSAFWNMLCPEKEYQPPSGALEQAIDAQFGALEGLVKAFNAKAAAVQGSGWGWLAYHPEAKTLVVTTSANQDPLNPTTGLIPLLGIDVWEHAYYLDYKNARPAYLKEVWRVINWKDVSRRYKDATHSS
ncbi:Superoxide dismutase [Mn] 1 [Chlorella vulgaris]